MGRVFTFAQIQEKKVPVKEVFLTVANNVSEVLTRTHGVIGGTFFGSFLTSYDRRSDLDCLVLYEPEKRREVKIVLQELQQFASKYDVPLELVPVDRDMASDKLHSIDSSFADHLRQSVLQHKGVFKTNPLLLFSFATPTPLLEVKHWMVHKAEYLEKGITRMPIMDDKELSRFLQKVLEVAVHAGRRIVWLKAQKKKSKVQGMSEDSKSTVIATYPAVADDRSIELFKKLTEADYQYGLTLADQIQSPNEKQYSKTIETLKLLAEDALQFVRNNSLLIFPHT